MYDIIILHDTVNAISIFRIVHVKLYTWDTFEVSTCLILTNSMICTVRKFRNDPVDYR